MWLKTFSNNCKIADFGLSKSDDLTATMASTVLESEYTPAWSAPGLSINEQSSLKSLDESAYSLNTSGTTALVNL